MVVDDISGREERRVWLKKVWGILVLHRRRTQPPMVHIPSKPPGKCETTPILMSIVSVL